MWVCYDELTKKRATVVHPIIATEVTYIGGIDIENTTNGL